MSSAAPPDAVSASSAGASSKKKKQKKKPKKAIETGTKVNECGQEPDPSPREEQTGDDEPDTPTVVSKPSHCTRLDSVRMYSM